jgi:long-chain acyl-CoA synthetase
MQLTFPRLLLKHAAERPGAAAMREKEYGIWQAHSWASMATLVEHIACGLHQAGLQRGEHMVVIGANRPRLYATMLAAQSLGAIPIPLYQDAVGAECVFPITNADVRFAMVEDQEQVDKLLEIATVARTWATSFLTTHAACAITTSLDWCRWTS